MGNQRELIQIEPRRCSGAVLRIRPEAVESAKAFIEPTQSRFYSRFIPRDQQVSFPNLDGDETNLGVLEGDHVIFQSGGKMWCGYENFVEHIRALAQWVDNALFYVGDEDDYIDEFRIQAHTLHYKRVHEGGWRDLQEYLTKR